MKVEKVPKVSVCVVSYNQEKYIYQCLQSIVDQVTDFGFEVIVGDDCSTDGTRMIVQEFADKYPTIVKPIFNEVNVGAFRNFIYVHDQAIGEYIAHIDGDDYMLPGKLSIQAEALDENPDCSMCVHAMKYYDQNNGCYRKLSLKVYPRKSDIAFLLMNLPFFSHSSKMYRADCRKGLESLTEDVLDCYVNIHQALKGNILYLNDILGVYRLNVGVASVKNNNKSVYKAPAPQLLKLYIDSIEYAGRSGIQANLISKATAKAYFDFAYNHLMAKDFVNFKLLINKSIATDNVHIIQRFFNILSFMPGVLFLLVRIRAGLREQLG